MAMVAIALVLVAPRVEHADMGYASVDEPFLTPHSFVELSDQPVCSLLDDLQNEAHLIGQDGATSVQADGQVFWSFNDTWVETASGAHMLIPNNIASTSDREASDCVSLASQASDGFAVPTLYRNSGELGVFPSGMFSVEPGYVHFYYASSVPNSGSELHYRIQGFGLGRFDINTGAGERLLGGQLLWDDNSFPGAHLDEALALMNESYIYVLLRLTLPEFRAGTLLARIPADEIDLSQYEYWDGSAWSGAIPDVSTPQAAGKALLWVQPIGMSAPSISYNGFLHKWVAVFTSGFAHTVEARVANDITGPWSDEPSSLAVDCLNFLPQPQRGFICYMAQQHLVYEKDGGRTLFVTYSNEDAYRVYLHEIRLAAPVSQWSDPTGAADYRSGDEKPADGYNQDGIAFYASDIPVPGFAAIHRWRDGATGALRLAALSPSDSYSDGGIAFYAPLDKSAAEGTNAAYAPVYFWRRGDLERYSALDLTTAGYTAQERAFFAACPDSDRDGVTDCDQSFMAGDWQTADPDNDGLSSLYERSTPGCDPLIYDDDRDGISTASEITSGNTNPCVWDSGYWGCLHAPLRDPRCDEDSDSDRCHDAWELGPDGHLGGERDPSYPWDYFNPSGDGTNRVDDILAVVARYYISAGDARYSTAVDRGGFTGPNAWNLAPPDGRIRIDDILAAVRSYRQDCS